MSKPLRRLVAAAALIAAPTSAHAHLINTSLGDFYDGLVHPLVALDNVLPWFALAILAAFQGPKNARWLLLTFPAGLLIGALVALKVPQLPLVPFVTLAIIAVVGLAVAATLKLPLPVLVAIGFVMALVGGYQNGQAAAAAADAWLFVLGVTAVGYVFVTLAAGCALAFLSGGGGWRSVALRASGSWVAAVGILALGMQVFVPGA